MLESVGDGLARWRTGVRGRGADGVLEIGEIGEIGEISWRDGGQGFEDVERILNVKDLFNPKDPW